MRQSPFCTLIHARLRGAAALPLEPPARRVPAVNFHLTVAFIGDVPASALAAVRRVGAAARAVRCGVLLDSYEYWPKPECVVALARSVPAPLQALWDGLHAALASAGFALRPKSLRPHVTLARQCRSQPALLGLEALGNVLRRKHTATSFCTQLSCFCPPY